jgi:hypothetical protein
MFDLHEDVVEDGIYSLKSVTVVTRRGIHIYLGGGQEAHIGSIAVSLPRTSLKNDSKSSCTTSVFNILTHKDDALAVPLAEDLCRKVHQPVVVTCGVHIENADQEEIDRLVRNSNMLTTKILNHFNNQD